MNKQQLHARKRRQFKSLCKQLNRLLKSEHLHTSKQKIKAVAIKIKQLIRELSGIIARWEMKKTLGAAAVIFGLATTPMQGQSFAEPMENPFGLSSNNTYINLPVLADFDGDGDMDLLIGEYDYSYSGDPASTLNYYENIGTPSEPEFAVPQPGAFGLSFPPLTYAYIALPAVADLDADGDMDLFSGISGYSYINGNEYNGGIYYFENTGSATNPQFEISERNPFGITIPASVTYDILVPSFADMDNDGDIDMLCSVFYGNFLYYENTENTVGTTQVQADFPATISPNPTTNYLNINTEEPLAQIEIYDLTGRQLAKYDGWQTQISIQDLSSGTYMIRLINQEGQYLSKKIEKL